MSERKIVYSLDFKANVSDASSQLDKLGHSLNGLASRKLIDGNQFDQAANAALRMKEHLDKALDPQTGKLDLTRLAVSMKNSGDSAKILGQQFATAGVEGQKAFMQVTNAIANAQPSMIKTSKLMDGLWTSLKNTAKWQISSAVLRGFTSSLSSAVSFAKELNKSLNDIRIVSGDSADEMTRFAKEANKMAKEIGTSTTDITQGTLIYRQQGDDMALAAQKAEITAKAAAITTESTAQEMSEYLTGIWNSYQVGSDELELFVDKLAYVGATTATSMEEIATSMTKVAATANTVGVEYEQLLGIIATVSSATRVSAEQVGTAYKTILARMGDLKLEGSIEEDGITTTLGDVSSTLKQVGIDVLDANGELKDMGGVIEELGDNWNNFSKAEQAAIANTIAGKRQYTQLFALFENWDKYQSSVEGATNAQGELNKEHQIYLESWEASSERIKANLEDIIMDAYNDEGILTLMNGLADTLGLLDKFIEGVGGLGPILLMLGAVGTRVFSQQIGNGLANTYTNLMILGGKSRQIANEMRSDFASTAKILASDMSGGFTQIETAQKDFIISLLDFQNKYDASYGKMSDSTRQFIELKKQDALQGFTDIQTKIRGIQTKYQGIVDLNFQTGTGKPAAEVTQLSAAYEKLGMTLDASKVDLQELINVLSMSELSISDINSMLDIFEVTLFESDDDRENFIADIQEMRDKINELKGVGQSLDHLGGKFEQLEDRTVGFSEKISHGASAMMSITSAGMSVNSMLDTLKSDTADFGEKFTSAAMTIPMVVMSMTQLTSALKAAGVAGKVLTASSWIGLLLMLAPAFVKLGDALIVTADEAREAALKEAEAYEETKQEIEDANKSLEEKKEKLEEIRKLEATEANRKQELQLLAEIELLEKKQKILQKTQELQEKQVIKTTETALKSTDKEIEENKKKVEQHMTEGVEEGNFSVSRVSGAYSDLLEQWYGDEGKINELLELADKSDTETASKIMKQVDSMNAYTEEMELNAAAAEKLKQEKGENAIVTKKELEITKEQIKKDRKAAEAKEELKKAEEEWANTISTTVEKMKMFDNSFDTVNKGIDEFKEKGRLSYETIAELQKQFGEAEEGMTEFYEGLANGTITLDQYKAKMSELIEQEMSEKILKGELNGANKAMIESYLKSKGVINAAEVAQAAYNLALEKNKISSMEVINKNGNLTKSFTTLAAGSNLTKKELLALAIQEKVINNSSLDLSDKIKELGKYAGAANAAGLQLISLKRAQNAITNVGGVEHLKKSYLESMGFKSKSAGDDKTTAIDNTFIKDGKEYTYEEAEYEILNPVSRNEIKLDFGNLDLNLGGTPKDSGGEEPKKPEAIDWVSILLRDAAQRTTWLEESIEKHNDELGLLDEEKGQIDKIIEKNHNLLWANREAQKAYTDRFNEQSNIFDKTMKSYQSSYGFNFDKDTVLSWFDAEGEESVAFANLLESFGSDVDTRDNLKKYWEDIKKIVDDVKEATEGLKELKLEEPQLVDNVYDSEIKKLEQSLELLEYNNDFLENSTFMNYSELRKNYAAIQDIYMTLYKMAIETGREADAREYLAKWWDTEANIVKSASEEFDEYKETYDAIAEEMKKREEEAIESLDYQIQRLQYRNTLTQSYNTALNTLRTTQHEINKELRNSMLSEKYLSEQEKEKIFNAKDYLILSKEISKIEEEIQDNYTKYQNKIKKLEDDQLYRAELLTKQFEAQTAEKQRALEILKMEIDLVKKREALTDALKEKNVRVYQGGQWVQIANYNAVQTAAEALAETEYQIAEKKIQNAQTLELTENEMRIAQLEEKKKVHEAEIKAIDDMTEVLEDAKTKWETGFDATAASAQDLAIAFTNAQLILGSKVSSDYSYNNRNSTSFGKFSSSKEGQDLRTIYNAKVRWENSSSEDEKATANKIAQMIRNNSSSTAVKATANMSVSQMKEKYGFAAGTNNTPAGIARVNEKGLELYATNSGHFIELNPHGKIFNNDQFNYLYTLSRGKTSIDANRSGTGALSIGQMTLALPNVTDTPSFVEGLKHLNEYIRNTMKF